MIRASRLLLAAIALVVCGQTAFAFREDFDSLDTSRWTVYRNGGSASVSNGLLSLSTQGDGKVAFPYLYLSSNPFPTASDFVMKVRMRFTSLQPYGIGLVCTTLPPPDGVYREMVDPNYTWTYWADSDHPSPGTAYHNLEWDYKGGTVTFIQDGITKTTSARPRPISIWLGNARTVPGGNYWSSLQVDYIEVLALPEPSAISVVVCGFTCLLFRRRFR